MSTAETIYELVKTLPEDRASMVLKFAEFLKHDSQSSSKFNQELASLYGACADDPIEIDDAGISDVMDDDLTGVFNS